MMKFWKKKAEKNIPKGNPELRSAESTVIEKDGLTDAVKSGIEDKRFKEYEEVAAINEPSGVSVVMETGGEDAVETGVRGVAGVDGYVDYAESGVFIFGRKIEGRVRKVFFTALAIGFVPPTFIFGVALLLCIFLLLFPLAAMLLLASFPTIIFSLLILFAVLPVVFPFIIIFLLFTEKGKLSVFSEGRLIILKLFRWRFPTI